MVGVAGRRGSHLLLRDEVEFVHPGQDRVSLANGFFKVVKRRKAIRASDEAGEHAPETEVSFRPFEVFRRELTIIGAFSNP